MEKTNNIDVLLTLNPSGWSTCFFIVGNKTFEFVITHVFSNPYADLMQALSNLINGQKVTTFYWYNEPGGQRFEIRKNSTQSDMVVVTINEFEELFIKEPKEFELTISFEIKLKQLITIFYLQLKKIHFLLNDKEFSENRAKYFPFQDFHKFEKLVTLH